MAVRFCARISPQLLPTCSRRRQNSPWPALRSWPRRSGAASNLRIALSALVCNSYFSFARAKYPRGFGCAAVAGPAYRLLAAPRSRPGAQRLTSRRCGSLLPPPVPSIQREADMRERAACIQIGVVLRSRLGLGGRKVRRRRHASVDGANRHMEHWPGDLCAISRSGAPRTSFFFAAASGEFASFRKFTRLRFGASQVSPGKQRARGQRPRRRAPPVRSHRSLGAVLLIVCPARFRVLRVAIFSARSVAKFTGALPAFSSVAISSALFPRAPLFFAYLALVCSARASFASARFYPRQRPCAAKICPGAQVFDFLMISGSGDSPTRRPPAACDRSCAVRLPAVAPEESAAASACVISNSVGWLRLCGCIWAGRFCFALRGLCYV